MAAYRAMTTLLAAILVATPAGVLADKGCRLEVEDLALHDGSPGPVGALAEIGGHGLQLERGARVTAA